MEQDCMPFYIARCKTNDQVFTRYINTMLGPQRKSTQSPRTQPRTMQCELKMLHDRKIRKTNKALNVLPGDTQLTKIAFKLNLVSSGTRYFGQIRPREATSF